jgi:alpha-beta hydrolase superfamily lysophospholipase
MEKYISVNDNVKLAVIEKKPNRDIKKIVIFCHGICEYKERYNEVSDYLVKNDYLTVLYDQRGHGNSSGKKGYIDNYLDFVEDLHYLIDYYHKEYPNINIVIIGHSMGGLVVNLYNTLYNDVEKIISIGAPGIYMSSVKPLKFLPLFLVKNFKIKNNFYKVLTSNMEYNLLQKDDPKCVSHMSLKLAKEMFIFGVKYLQKNINNCKTPIYYLHGKNDQIVSYKSSEYLFKNNPMAKDLKLFDGLGHEILNEPSKKEEIYKVVNDILLK